MEPFDFVGLPALSRPEDREPIPCPLTEWQAAEAQQLDARAVAEARAILAETEPCESWTGERSLASLPRIPLSLPGDPSLPALRSLAESLAAFVTCPAIPAGFGTNPYDCACGGCNNGRRR